MINPKQIIPIINTFDYVLGAKLNYDLAVRYAQSNRPISLGFDSEHIANYLQFFDFTA